MENRAELSVIIANYNTRELLKKCLNSIYQNQHGMRVQVIVVDNASTDGSVAMVRETFPQAVLIENPKNLGFARAVNQGLRCADGNYLLLLNSDTEIADAALARSAEFLNSHPDAGIVGCKLLNPDGSVQPSCESFLSLRGIFFETFFLETLFPRSRLFGRMHLTYLGYDSVEKVDYVKGAFLMTRRQVLDDIGTLDEDFFFYAEEMDWCYRARQKKWEVYFTPEAEVIHYGGQSADSISPDMFVQLHKARLQFYRKHHGPIETAMARSLLAIGALLRLAAWSAIALSRIFIKRSKYEYARKKVSAFLAVFLWHLGLGKINR